MGLLEEPIRLVRIGDPSCESIAAGFELLTGFDSIHNCEGSSQEGWRGLICGHYLVPGTRTGLCELRM